MADKNENNNQQSSKSPAIPFKNLHNLDFFRKKSFIGKLHV